MRTTTEVGLLLDQRDNALVEEQDELDALDFQQILAQPMLAYEEGFRFFRGKGLINRTLRKLASDLDEREIPYAVIGAMALNLHGYHRFTTDVDVVMTKEGLERFRSALVGRRYRYETLGAHRRFRSVDENVPIHVFTTDTFPGDGKPKAITFPNSPDATVKIDGIQTVTLAKLIELKLASGMTAAARLKDLADVQELIRVLGLGADYSERIDISVREMYRELNAELILAEAQDSAPDKD